MNQRQNADSIGKSKPAASEAVVVTASAVELPVELEEEDHTVKQPNSANSSQPTVIHYCNEKESQEVLARAATYAQDRYARLMRTQADADRLLRGSFINTQCHRHTRRSDNPRIHYCSST